MAEILQKFEHMWETVLGVGMAVWGWIILRSVRHGEKLAGIEHRMVTRDDFDSFMKDRKQSFERFSEEQQLLIDELRASMMESMRLQRRATRRMHRQNERQVRQLIDALKNEGKGGS